MRRCLLLSAALVLGFAPAPLPRPQRRAEPPNPLLGLWEGNVRLEDGPPIGPSQLLRITPRRMIYAPGPESREYVLRIDRSRRPATYQIEGAAGGRVEGRRFWGVWRVEKDVLTLTYNSCDEPPPTGFERDRRGGIVEVYRRVKR